MIFWCNPAGGAVIIGGPHLFCRILFAFALQFKSDLGCATWGGAAHLPPSVNIDLVATLTVYECLRVCVWETAASGERTARNFNERDIVRSNQPGD